MHYFLPLFLSIPVPYTSHQFCHELHDSLMVGVEENVISNNQADHIVEQCLQTYTEGL